MEQVYGCIERITFQNSETGFTVAKLVASNLREEVCLVGSMPGVRPGETVRCSGEWKRHLVHGLQFDVKNCNIEAPADVLGIKKYLGSGLVKGIGKTYAEKIVDVFGIDTLNVIDETPEKLLEIAGIGSKRVGRIKSCWAEQKAIRDVMIFLQGNGISPAFAQKIFKAYGSRSIEVVKNNPFTLARDIFGIGFKSADSVAKKMGIAHDAPGRIEAGIEFVLFELSSDGHVCYPLQEFLAEAEKVLEVEKEKIQERIPFLKEEKRISVDEILLYGVLTPFIWVRRLFISERGIAGEIFRLRREKSALRDVDVSKALTWVQEKLKIDLAENQKQAVSKALTDKFLVITGGPGTGKSTITNAILTITKKLTSRIILAAPTGRAAKRMSEITGRTAKTIHSLLEFDFRKGGFKKNRENPLECDLIIVDEASMIDTVLMYSLLRAVPHHARVVLVGDIHQLPSVGPGNVLKDIISSQQVPVVLLNEIFRQAAGSKIITNAHLINKGVFPDIRNQRTGDFFFIEAEEKEDVLREVQKLVKERLPKGYAFDPIEDIQVLTPMKKGVVGTENLNTVLQKELNGKNSPQFMGGRFFAANDKVMQIRNNYTKEVFNGDIGRVEKIEQSDQKIFVRFEERLIEYTFSEVDELVLAYAVSVHKYQGSECPCVVMPVHTTHFVMLFRNLLYTGVTRGKKLVVLVGNKRGLAIAVKNDEVKNRYTGLVQALSWVPKDEN